MKNKTIICLLLVIVIGVVFIIWQRVEINSYKEDVNLYKEEIKLLEKNEEGNQQEGNKYYDCTYTETYRIVDKLDGYVAEVPEMSYIVVDKFQSHEAYSHPIITDLKENLEVNKYYEFTYQIKGTGIINDKEDVISHITDESLEDIPDGTLRVNLTIKETDKEGMEQIQEDICDAG